MDSLFHSTIMALTDFLSKDDQNRISEAIANAEKCTSGEICVHITPKCSGEVMKVAEKTFNKLGLYKTERRNAVLIYVAYKSKKFAILGDQGINQVVPSDYWETEKDTLGKFLSEGKPGDGLCEVVRQIGDALSSVFPPVDNDLDELSNEVSYAEADE